MLEVRALLAAYLLYRAKCNIPPLASELLFSWSLFNQWLLESSWGNRHVWSLWCQIPLLPKLPKLPKICCRSLQIWSWRSWTCQTPSCDCGERHTHSGEPVKVASCTQCPKPEDAWLMHGLGMRSPELGWWSYRFDFLSCYLVLLYWSSMIQHSIIQKGPAAIDSCDGWNLWHAMSGRISSHCRVDHSAAFFPIFTCYLNMTMIIYIYVYIYINIVTIYIIGGADYISIYIIYKDRI